MDITEVKIFPVIDKKVKAYVSIVLDNCFIVRDLKVIDGDSKLFVAMPSKKMKDGSYRDMVHPLDNPTRLKIESIVIEAYEKQVAEKQTD